MSIEEIRKPPHLIKFFVLPIAMVYLFCVCLVHATAKHAYEPLRYDVSFFAWWAIVLGILQVLLSSIVFAWVAFDVPYFKGPRTQIDLLISTLLGSVNIINLIMVVAMMVRHFDGFTIPALMCAIALAGLHFFSVALISRVVPPPPTSSGHTNRVRDIRDPSPPRGRKASSPKMQKRVTIEPPPEDVKLTSTPRKASPKPSPKSSPPSTPKVAPKFERYAPDTTFPNVYDVTPPSDDEEPEKTVKTSYSVHSTAVTSVSSRQVTSSSAYDVVEEDEEIHKAPPAYSVYDDVPGDIQKKRRPSSTSSSGGEQVDDV